MKKMGGTLCVLVIAFISTCSLTNAETKNDTEKKSISLPVVNKDIIQGRWDELKGKIKQQWGKITDDDLLKMKGSYQELHGILQQKYGYEKARIEKEIKEFLEKNNPDTEE